MRRHRRLHRRQRQHRNKVIVMSLFGLVLLLSCGYAAFQTSISLTAKGTISTKLSDPTITSDGTITFNNSCSTFTCTIYSDSIDGGSTVTTENSSYLADSNYIIATISSGTNSKNAAYSNSKLVIDTLSSDELSLSVGIDSSNTLPFTIVESYKNSTIGNNIVSLEAGVTENQTLMWQRWQRALESGSVIEGMIASNPALEDAGLDPENMYILSEFLFGVSNISDETTVDGATIKNLLIKFDTKEKASKIKFIAYYNSPNRQWKLVDYTQIENYIYIPSISSYEAVRLIAS